jgi:hypothetical protein
VEAGCGSGIQGRWQRITVLHLCRGAHVGAGVRRSRGATLVVLRGIAAAGRSQERRAGGRARGAGACAGNPSVTSSLCGKGRMVGRHRACGDARPCPAFLPVMERHGKSSADRRHTRIPKENKHSVGVVRQYILWATRQAGQLSGWGEPFGGQRSRKPAGRLSPVLAARMG